MPDKLFTVGDYDVAEMELTWEKVSALWERIQEYKTIFSDLTAGNFDNFVRLLIQPHTYWVEISSNGTLNGIIYFERMESTVEAFAHLLFFDRKPAEKVEVCNHLIDFMFDNFPLNRITAEVPQMYYGVLRLLEKLQFTREGVRRRAVLIGGRWNNIVIMGITRSEVTNVVSVGGDSDTRTDS